MSFLVEIFEVVSGNRKHFMKFSKTVKCSGQIVNAAKGVLLFYIILFSVQILQYIVILNCFV